MTNTNLAQPTDTSRRGSDISGVFEEGTQDSRLSDEQVRKEIYDHVYSVVKGMLSISKEGTHDLCDWVYSTTGGDFLEVLLFREHYGEINESFTTLPTNPIYWHIVLGYGNLIDYVPSEKNGERPTWKLKKNVRVYDGLIEGTTDEIMHEHLNRLRCNYLGVHTLREYWDKVNPAPKLQLQK